MSKKIFHALGVSRKISETTKIINPQYSASYWFRKSFGLVVVLAVIQMAVFSHILFFTISTGKRKKEGSKLYRNRNQILLKSYFKALETDQ